MLELYLLKNENSLKRNEYSVEEEEEIYASSLQDVYDNPRWYLDHLESLAEYRVSWKNYRNGYQITLPKQYLYK